MSTSNSVSPVVRLEREGAIAHLVIARPEQQNTIDYAVMDALDAHLAVVEADPSCTGLLLSTEGREAFIAGGDLRAFRDIGSEDRAYEMARRMADLLRRLERLPALVVAAVEGYAFGGGCETLLACDWVIASPSSTFGLTQAQFAVTPGWGGAARLVRKVGRSQAMRLLLTSPTLSAIEAMNAGLVDQVADKPRVEAMNLLARVPTNRELVRTIKQVVDSDDASLEAAIRRERSHFVDTWIDDAHADAVEAFFLRRSRPRT